MSLWVVSFRFSLEGMGMEPSNWPNRSLHPETGRVWTEFDCRTRPYTYFEVTGSDSDKDSSLPSVIETSILRVLEKRRTVYTRFLVVTLSRIWVPTKWWFLCFKFWLILFALITSDYKYQSLYYRFKTLIPLDLRVLFLFILPKVLSRNRLQKPKFGPGL